MELAGLEPAASWVRFERAPHSNSADLQEFPGASPRSALSGCSRIAGDYREFAPENGGSGATPAAKQNAPPTAGSDHSDLIAIPFAGTGSAQHACEMAPPGGARAVAALLLFHSCSTGEDADSVPDRGCCSSAASVVGASAETPRSMGFRHFRRGRPYRASWQLPGPDSHRQATTSLCWLSYSIGNLQRWAHSQKRCK